MAIAEAARFYGWSFDECWEMPARRFFAMVLAARRLRAMEMLDLLDITFAPVSAKLYDVIRDRHMDRYESAKGYKPKDVPKLAFRSQPMTEAETATAAFEQFALLKRLRGYGG